MITDPFDSIDDVLPLPEPRPYHARSRTLLTMEHRDGIAWNEAPLPPRWHRCRWQTEESFLTGYRCACGAIGTLQYSYRKGHGVIAWKWSTKNSRRRAS